MMPTPVNPIRCVLVGMIAGPLISLMAFFIVLWVTQ